MLRAAAHLDLDRDTVTGALESVSLVLPSPGTILAAGQLGPASLRSLYALQLATALELGDDLEGVVGPGRFRATQARRDGAERPAGITRRRSRAPPPSGRRRAAGPGGRAAGSGRVAPARRRRRSR